MATARMEVGGKDRGSLNSSTFIRSMPRRKPPASPAGLSQTDELHTRKIV